MSEDNTQQSEQQPTGIIGEVTNLMHKLEDGLEHLVDGAKQAAQDDEPGQEGNADASNAGLPSESATQASATNALNASGTQGTQSRPVSAEQAEAAIAKLRVHLWTFSQDAVSTLHAELDKLETFIKSV